MEKVHQKENKIDKKTLKRKGPIRFEAILPVFILSLLTYFYFSFYFDHHLKSVLEYTGTRINGAEVNIKSLSTNFFKGSFDIDQIQITDPKTPEFNSLVIGNIHFDYLWDALLRMKFVVESAQIKDIQLMVKRQLPGKVLPPSPAKPSKLDELELEVTSHIQKKYQANVLGDLAEVLQSSGDFDSKLQNIKNELKSQKRIEAMIQDAKEKETFWNKKIKAFSKNDQISQAESALNKIKKEKNFLKQAESAKKLTDLLKDLNRQFNEIQEASKNLQSEIKTISTYPEEIQNLIEEDMKDLKRRFSLPELNFKDMASHLFAAQFASYIIKARKYKSVAEQYIPEKKNEEQVIVPRQRSEGKSFEFPKPSGYPLFWLKEALISSKGSKDSYQGNVSGILTNLTTSPKQIKIPTILDLKGDFPASKIYGVKAKLTSDFTQDVGKQTALIHVDNFPVPRRMFSEEPRLSLGIKDSKATSTVWTTISEENISMTWTSLIKSPTFIINSENNLAKEMLTNITKSIQEITIDGKVQGTFSNFDLDLKSNLGTELARGLEREIGAKVARAEEKLNQLINDQINDPQKTLNNLLSKNQSHLSQVKDITSVYNKYEKKIQSEIKNLQKSNGLNDLKEKGKKLLKGFKL